MVVAGATLTLNNLKHYTFDDRYYADTAGNVYFNRDVGRGASARKKHDKVSSFLNKYGYTEYILLDCNSNAKHIQAHRIVASLFIPQPSKDKKYVNHIDGNKQNNDITNLEWCTASENELHSFNVLGKIPWNKGIIGLVQNKPNQVMRMSLEGIVEKIYNSPKEAEIDGYSLKQISAVCNNRQNTHKGKLWKYVN